MPYRAPVADILFSLRHLGGLDQGVASGLYPDLADDAADAILDEAGRVAETLLLPLDRMGDRHGVTFLDGAVVTPPGWSQAYHAWRDGGWNGVAAPADFGGMGLPTLVNAACLEIWSAANASFALGPVLTMGATEALHRHGSDELKAIYLHNLVSGAWTGTMNLTEPQAGSDVGALRARATPVADGTYRITGQKIYITYGEHDLSDNIVHLVLARLPDAPSGTRGISLFLVPKFIPKPDGTPGERNDLICGGIEHKLGMHASPTCTMMFGENGGATGWLIGEPHRGLACMFTMMNNARLAVGLQGVAAAERATQTAIAFAKTRRQGRNLATPSDGPSPIIDHPDVARMLLTMKAQTAAARGLCHLVAGALDQAARGPEAGRATAQKRAALLTPIAKAYATDIANEVASLGVQVHGGMGYIEDTGAAQIMRDVRIAAIYEGTNGIQAIDLVQRKIALDGGAVVAAEIAEMRVAINLIRGTNETAFGQTAARLHDAVEALEAATQFLLNRLATAPAQVLLGATSYLRLFGLARGGTALAVLAHAAGRDPNAPAALVTLCRFFAEQIASAAPSLATAIIDGAEALEGAEAIWADA
ncbi:acyl-CoA dehydrogenase [Lichenihabitans psoromatis]|uniref:acyl-CoA dehydrogenase n=1 Tax=Lichenihabitans psoromatis TaxID=2528642 RepID=UPI001036791E|nr:acyl-CoA dehydrogenase [Lichenihabitans psoromatis]